MGVEEYIAEFDDIMEKLNCDADKKVDVAIAIMGELAKDRRMQEIREERKRNNEKSATQKQIAFLENLGVEVKEGLTKKEASKLIDEALNNNNSY